MLSFTALGYSPQLLPGFITKDSLICLRAVPTGLISRRPTPIVGRFPSADSRGFKILNMFDRASQQTITESVAESADSAVESADYWSRPTGNWPSGYGPLVHVLIHWRDRGLEAVHRRLG